MGIIDDWKYLFVELTKVEPVIIIHLFCWTEVTNDQFHFNNWFSSPSSFIFPRQPKKQIAKIFLFIFNERFRICSRE